MYDEENKFKKEYDKVLEKIKEIFNIECDEDIDVLNFIDYDDSVSFLVSVEDFCTLDIHIYDNEIEIYVYDIGYSEIDNINNIVKNIYKLIEECNK
jgi:hypothetical protein